MQGKIFQQFEDKRLEDFERKDAAEVIGRYITDQLGQSAVGLTLLGPPGIGKTYLACMVLKAANVCGLRTECIEMATYVDMFKESFKCLDVVRATGDERVADRVWSVEQRIKSIQGLRKPTQLLLLDDVGREFASVSGWSSQQFYDTIRSRFNRGYPTIITSNMPLEYLETRYTEGLSSFLHEATHIIEIGSEDHRAKRADRDGD